MRLDKLENMVGGWVLGDFTPSVLRTDKVEFAVKHYKKGDAEAAHHHKVATEVTVIVSGSAVLAGRELKAGDIAVLEPGESADFRCLTDVVTAVIKMPSVLGDKYPG